MKKVNKNIETQRVKTILEKLSERYPVTETQLQSMTAFQLLVAVILSAQCTDARVNIVTKDLFAKYPAPEDYVNITPEELEKLIFSTGFYKAKAKNIKAMAIKLLDDFGGVVPDTMEDLLKLPGVGRKSANVIMGDWFNKPVGIVVDTHVIRISNRLDFCDTNNPEKIELALTQIIPKEKWVPFTHYLILLGRSICKARRPLCADCFIAENCNSKDKTI
ncbi:MAG: endonuclease III [bacterium]